MRGRSLRARLTLLYTGLAAIVLGLSLLAVYAVTRSEALSRLDKSLRADAAALKSRAEGAEGGEGAAPDERFVNARDVVASGHMLALRDSGRVIASSPVARDLVGEAVRRHAFTGADQMLSIDVDGQQFRVAVVPADTGEYAIAAGSLEQVTEAEESLLHTALIAGAIGILVTAIGAWFATRRGLRPLESITAVANDVASDAMELRTGLDDQDEIGAVAAAIDRMLNRLQQAFDAQRRFLEDVSHELRTPLTLARGHLELVAENSEATAEERSEAVSVAIEEIDRVARLVDGLLQLARATEVDRLSIGAVPVAPLLEAVAGQMSPAAGPRVAGPGTRRRLCRSGRVGAASDHFQSGPQRRRAQSGAAADRARCDCAGRPPPHLRGRPRERRRPGHRRSCLRALHPRRKRRRSRAFDLPCTGGGATRLDLAYLEGGRGDDRHAGAAGRGPLAGSGYDDITHGVGRGDRWNQRRTGPVPLCDTSSWRSTRIRMCSSASSRSLVSATAASTGSSPGRVRPRPGACSIGWPPRAPTSPWCWRGSRRSGRTTADSSITRGGCSRRPSARCWCRRTCGSTPTVRRRSARRWRSAGSTTSSLEPGPPPDEVFHQAVSSFLLEWARERAARATTRAYRRRGVVRARVRPAGGIRELRRSARVLPRRLREGPRADREGRGRAPASR